MVGLGCVRASRSIVQHAIVRVYPPSMPNFTPVELARYRHSKFAASKCRNLFERDEVGVLSSLLPSLMKEKTHTQSHDLTSV